MKQKKQSLAVLLLVPLLAVVLVQGLLPFSTLLASGTRETMVANAVDIDENLVQNREVVLKNAMVDQWSAVRKESSYLDAVLEACLEEQESSAEAFLTDSALKQDFLERVYPELFAARQLVRRVPDPCKRHGYRAGAGLYGLFPARFRSDDPDGDKFRPSV